MRVFGLTGWSGSGKTTLITRLLPALIAGGRTVSTVKHAHHGFDVDRPGKDSFSHRTAGATEVLVSSPLRFALMHELRGAREPELVDLLELLSPVDLVIVEGFKREPHPKLEIHRAEVGRPLIQPDDPDVVAVASDAPVLAATVPVVMLADLDAIVALVLAHAIPLAEAVARNRATP